MIKVLQIGMTDNLGGIENYLINYYRKIDKSKIQFDFVNIYPNNLCFQDEIESMGGKVYRLSSYYKHPYKYIKELVTLIKNNNYDIIHCNMNSAVMLYPLIGAKVAGVKCIIAHSHNASSDKGFFKSFLHFINKHFIPFFANFYFACSLKAGEWFYSKKNINSNRFYIIKNGINLKDFSFDAKSRNKVRQSLKIDNNQILIGHVGRFNKQKNHKYLVDLFFKIKQNDFSDKYKLVLIGTGPLLDNIKKAVVKQNLKNDVIFLGQRSDVNKLMSAMDIFILPSLYEGLPLVGVEAQKSGLYCLFSDNVTRELKISPGCNFISLKSQKDFVDKIISFNNKRFLPCDNSYDICYCAKNLENTYLEMIDRGN